MKSRARINRKNRPVTQGHNFIEDTSQPNPLNNHQPRMGTVHFKRRRKCHCKECCSGNKRTKIALSESVQKIVDESE